MNQIAFGNIPSTVPQQYLDIFNPCHHIFENVYLGNLRAYMSVDPKFLDQYEVTDSPKNHTDDPIFAEKLKQSLDTKGCSQLGIQYVLSATQFQPKATVKATDWSRFNPNLENLGVERLQLRVDDDEFAWKNLEPLLEDAFAFIDRARKENSPLLIHCVKGASRSVTILTAYLMKRCGVSCDEALNYIKTKRSIAELKPSIRKGLEGFEKNL